MKTELLDHFQNEWMHRHSHFWKILSSMLIVNVIITSFPICSDYFNINLNKLSINLKWFPSIGIFFSVICLLLLLIESQKIAFVRNQINNQLHMEGVNLSKSKFLSLKPIDFFVSHINYVVSILVFVVMVTFSIYMIIVI